MNYITLTTNKPNTVKIEDFFKSPLLTHDRTISLGQINHFSGFNTVQIFCNDEFKIEDIFWFGFYSAEL